MLGNVLFIRVCRLTDLGSAKTFRHQRRRVFCVCVCWMWCVLNVLAGGSPSFMAVLNFVVVNVWNSHSFLFQPPPPPRIVFHAVTLPPLMDDVELWIGVTVVLHITSAPNPLSYHPWHPGSKSAWKVFGLVDVWSRAHFCFSVMAVTERELTSDTDLRAV